VLGRRTGLVRVRIAKKENSDMNMKKTRVKDFTVSHKTPDGSSFESHPSGILDSKSMRQACWSVTLEHSPTRGSRVPVKIQEPIFGNEPFLDQFELNS
jgi:hypothetical protein